MVVLGIAAVSLKVTALRRIMLKYSVADRVNFELLLCGPVAGHIGEPADTVALEAAMQGRSRQVRDGWLQRVDQIALRVS